jgi:hypothetical protein
MMMPPPRERGTTGVGKSAVIARKNNKGKNRTGPIRRIPVKDVKDDVPRVALREGFVWVWQQCGEWPGRGRIQSYRCAGRCRGCLATLRTVGGEVKSVQGIHLFDECKVGYWLSLMPAEERSVTSNGVTVQLDPEEALVGWMTRLRKKGRQTVKIDEHSLAGIRRARRENWIKPGETGDRTTDAFARTRRWMAGARVIGGDLKYALFVSKRGSELLRECEIWSVDTAFATLPEGSKQMLNVLGFDGNAFVPLGFAFLPNEDPETFGWALLEILDFLTGPKESGVAVKRIMTNFVEALRRGIHLAFGIFYDMKKRKEVRKVIEGRIPNGMVDMSEKGNDLDAHQIQISYCLFGFNQAMFRFCATTYKAGHGERAMAERFLAFFLWLPYFEIDEIKELVEKLHRKAGVRVCTAFMEYFLGTWMPRIEMWKVDMDDGIATNVGIEAFHMDLKRFFTDSEPRNWAVVQAGLHHCSGNWFRTRAKAGDRDSTKLASPRRKAVMEKKERVFLELKAWIESVEPPPDTNGERSAEKTEESIRGNSDEDISMEVPNGSACWYVYGEHGLRKRNGKKLELDIALNKSIESDRDNDMSIVAMMEKIKG